MRVEGQGGVGQEGGEGGGDGKEESGVPEHANGACMLEIIERGRGEG